MSDERLGEELKRYGLEGMGGDPVDVLLRHIYANHEAALGAKDGTIASLESQNQALQERAEKAEARAIEMERLKDAQKNKRRVAQRASASQGPAIERLKAQNQTLQEALRKIKTLAEEGSYDDGSMLPEIEDLARNALSPTQETDPE
jgi:uncharacterized membrane protein YgaE (UPF0421/DUF939 family)